MNDLPTSRKHRAQTGKTSSVDVGLHDGTNAGKTFRTASEGLRGLVTPSHRSPHCARQRKDVEGRAGPAVSDIGICGGVGRDARVRTQLATDDSHILSAVRPYVADRRAPKI